DVGPQGPYAHGCFRWRGVHVEGIPSLQWQLLQALFDGEQPLGLVRDEALIEKVYGHDAGDKQEALKQLRKYLNARLLEEGVRGTVAHPRRGGGCRFEPC